MKLWKSFSAIVVVAGSFLFGAASNAQRIDDQLMLGYVEWIVNHSDLSYDNHDLPEVVYLAPLTLQQTRYGIDTWKQLTQQVGKLPEVAALYDHIHNRILLNNEIDFSNWTNDHVIVHELVHYLQNVNQLKYECVAEMEPLAYELQVKWQNQHDHPGDRPDPFKVALISVGCLRI